MILETDHDYHMRRARAEFDLAYRSECRPAIESHLRLSVLHMQRLNSAQPAPPGLRSPPRTLFPRHVSMQESCSRRKSRVRGFSASASEIG